MENERGSWGSSLGFLMAAIGSAVGLGNIWGFPYKMGACGGFPFLLVYLALGVFVGFVILISELALGRRTRQSVVDAYRTFSPRFGWVGWLAMFSPFLVMSFYTALGGWCMEYLALNCFHLAFGGAETAGGSALFSAMLKNPLGSAMFAAVFLILCSFIVRSGISGGIEKFNTVGMPALFGMLAVIIFRSLTLPGAQEGLKFMFLPGYAVRAGFLNAAPDFITVLSTAGGQMFFSLSLAMGAMVTYGSYLGRKENLVKNAALIVTADTLVALMAGVAVIPAAVANGIREGTALSDIPLGGPSLLFVTLQDVFGSMGAAGPLFGVLFYLLVLIAAVSSAISLMEVLVTYFLDRARRRGRTAGRGQVTLRVSLAIAAEALVVAVDGLGANGLWIPGRASFGACGWNESWLAFVDCWSEGIAMPLGAMLTALMIGWEKGPKSLLPEIHAGIGRPAAGLDRFYTVCIRLIAPGAMALILAGQILSFFSSAGSSGTAGAAGYAVSFAVLAGFWAFAALPSRRRRRG